MFAIIVYDINVDRVAKILKISRKYFNWVQNSVFEGEITEAKLEKYKIEVKKIINTEEDSIIIYTFRDMKYSHRETLGKDKGGDNIFL
ncbi:MAG TPA: CRISPR-associated endonuclease Cas2 [Candidatus Eremiobacteraeota bacterium]|nr:CRISPR-associated endonuclease Cas2 [Candidatus Eremiobacteraeota bacterium]